MRTWVLPGIAAAGACRSAALTRVLQRSELRRAAAACAEAARAPGGPPAPPAEAWLPLHDWARGRRLAKGELLVRYWVHPGRGDGGPSGAAGTAEGEVDPFTTPIDPSAVDPSAGARLRQLARIRASRPVLLAGVATLLDDGRGDGTAAGLVHALRDWAGDYVGELADEVAWALTPTALQLFPGATWRCPALALPLEDLGRCASADGRSDRDGIPQALLLLHPRRVAAANAVDGDDVRPLRLLLRSARERDTLRAALRRAAAQLSTAASALLRAAPTAAASATAAAPLLLLVDAGGGAPRPQLTWRPAAGAPLSLGVMGPAGGARLFLDTAAGAAELHIAAAALRRLKPGALLRCAAPVPAAPGVEASVRLAVTSRAMPWAWRPLHTAALRAAMAVAAAAVATMAADAAEVAEVAFAALPPAMRAPALRPLLRTRSAAAVALAAHAVAALCLLLLLRSCVASLRARTFTAQLLSLQLRAAKGQPREAPKRARAGRTHRVRAKQPLPAHPSAEAASPYDELCRSSLDHSHAPAPAGGDGASSGGYCSSSDPGSSSEADADGGDSDGSDFESYDDVAGLPPACLSPDGAGVHPLWPRYCCVWGDGAPEGPPVPGRGSAPPAPGASRHAAAVARFTAMLDWRAATGMDTALTSPQPVFHLMKALYPHALHGTARDGSPLLLERAGRVGALGRGLAEARVSPALAALHLAFLYEFITARVDARPLPHGRVVRVLDVAGLSFGDVAAGSTRDVLAAAQAVLAPYYPERSAAVFVVNAPPGFALAFSMVAPLLARRTLARFRVFGAGEADKRAAAAAMLALVDAAQLPAEYGGACRCGAAEGEAPRCWRHHPEEEALWSVAERATPLHWRLPRPPGEAPLGLGGVPPGAALPPALRRDAEASTSTTDVQQVVAA